MPPLPWSQLEQVTIDWFRAVESFRTPVVPRPFPPPDNIVELAGYFASARELADDPQLSIVPILYDPAAQSHKQYMDDIRAAMGWRNAILQMQADFGQDAGNDLRTVLLPVVAATNDTEELLNCYQGDTCQMWWIPMCEFVVNEQRRPDSPWFDFLYEDALVWWNEYGQCQLPWPTPARISSYLNSLGDYVDMCEALEQHMDTLCEASLESTYRAWRSFIQRGSEVEVRHRRYNDFRSMVSASKGGLWPYRPIYARRSRKVWQEADIQSNDDALNGDIATFERQKAEALREADRKVFIELPTRDDGISTTEYVNNVVQLALDEKDVPEGAHLWQRADQRINDLELGDAAENLLAALNEEMQTNVQNRVDLARGPEYMHRVAAWRDLRSGLPGNPAISRNSKARLEDITDRVFDFQGQFGVLLECLPVAADGINDEFCERLVQSVQAQMRTIGNETWKRYEDFVYKRDIPADLTRMRERRRNRRTLASRGLDYPPHSTDPNVLSRGGQEAYDLEFDAARSGAGGAGQWHFAGTVGEGGFGHAGLWQQYSLTGEVLDRMTVKESYLDDRFDSNNYWVGHLCRRVVKEDEISRSLSNLPDSGNIVESQGCAIYESRRMYRV